MCKIKYIFTAIFLSLSLFAKDATLTNTIEINGSINDMFTKSEKIYLTTDIGSAYIIDLKTKKIIKSFKFDKIKDFLGDLTDTNVYSIDEDRKSYIFVLQGESGHTRVVLIKNGKKQEIIKDKDGLNVMKARFISNDRILFALMSSELILYDIKSRKEIYDKQISQMKFANFKLNEDKSKLAFCDEGGDIKIVDTKSGKILKRLTGENKDNVYQVDYKNGIVATAGKDKKCAIYNLKNGSSYHKDSNFLIYSVGLSGDGKLCGYQSDDKNSVTIFNTSTKESVYRLKGDKSFVTNIIFLDKSHIIISAKNKIKFWNLKGE